MLDDNKIQRIKAIIDEEAKTFLYHISVYRNHELFGGSRKKASISSSCTGFDIIAAQNSNNCIVDEESHLEGSIRVFLVNPILKRILEFHGIKTDWRFGVTFSDSSIANNVYEKDNFVEFTMQYRHRKIGVRYTHISSSLDDPYYMQRDYYYLFEKKALTGFHVIQTIDELYTIDWSGESQSEINQRVGNLPKKLIKRTKEISLYDFFIEFLSEEEYDLFISETTRIISKARKIIALRAMPQLLPNNLLLFKESVLAKLYSEKIDRAEYQFTSAFEKNITNTISAKDHQTIKNRALSSKLIESIIGDADFAKSFITAEYLFQTIPGGLGIDYTAVVVGYLKSIEQLMYIFYANAFKGRTKLFYWDFCHKLNAFDESEHNYRFEPYSPEKKIKQEKYAHRIKTGDKAPTIGELVCFLRYYEPSWGVSEKSKEYIISCLNDYCEYCRNHHLHKDNINSTDYDTVITIRNNTRICIYYLLGAFNLLCDSDQVNKQLGMTDISFDMLFEKIRNGGCFFVTIETSSGYNGAAYYLNRDISPEYDDNGILIDCEMQFVKIDKSIVEAGDYTSVHLYLDNPDYIRKNTIIISRNSMPLSIDYLPYHPKF